MRWLRILRKILVNAALLYAFVLVYINYVDPTPYIRCDLYTEEMNGGPRKFQEKTYNILLCGYLGLIDPGNFPDDEVRLQIFSESGELLAQRYLKPIFGMGEGSYDVEYGADYLIYKDGEGEGYQKRIAMPPSRLDWIRARLPRFAPLIFWPRL